MSAVRIRKTIDSDTLHLPELGAFIGHTVDIVIEDQPDGASAAPGVVAGTGDWEGVLKAAQQLENYDYDAQRDQDSADNREMQDRSR